MTDMHFTEDDKKQVIEFLNMTAKHARLDLSTAEIINYFKLLSHMQAKILPKIDANILEVKRVIEAQQPEQEEPKKGKK
jgi:hypothetical protein